MFDTVNLTQKRVTEVVDRHITVKRAPTDESIKFLHEFEKAAENKFVGRFNVDTNIVKSTGVYFMDEFSGERKVLVKFNLNDKDYWAEIELKYHEATQNPEEIAKLVFTRLSEWIAANILQSQVEFFKMLPRRK